jgi:hypothetical protein
VAYISSVVQEAETRTKNADVLVAGKKGMPAGTTNQPFFEPGRRSETHSEKLRNSWPPRSEEQSTDVSHDEIMLFSLGHLHACDEAKKFNRILQRQEASIVEIRRRIFNPAKRKCLGRALRSPFVKSFYSKIMHRIVGVKRRLMTLGAAGLPEKECLATQLLFTGFLPIKPSKHVELRSGRKIEKFLELGHLHHLVPGQIAAPFFSAVT